MYMGALPQIGIESRDNRIAFAVLSPPFFAIISTIAYVIAITRPIRAVNDQLKKAWRQFETAITNNTSWAKPASPTRQKGPGKRRRRNKVSVNANGSVTATSHGLSPSNLATQSSPNTPRTVRSSASGTASNDGNDSDDRYSVFSGASGTFDNLGEDSSPDLGEEELFETQSQQPRESIVLTTKAAWEAMAGSVKASSGLPEVRALQKRVISLCDYYYALLLAHEIKLKGSGTNQQQWGRLLSDAELKILRQLKLDVDERPASISQLQEDGPGGANASTVNIPTQLSRTGMLHPTLQIPFFLRRGNRFAGDNGAVAFYVSRSSDSYVVGYSGTVEALTPEGVATGDLAIEALKHNPTPPPLTFDASRKLQPLKAEWFATVQFAAQGTLAQGQSVPGPSPLNFFDRTFGYGMTLLPLTLAPSDVDERVQGIASESVGDRVRHCSRVNVTLQALNGRTFTQIMARCHLAETYSGDSCKAPGGVWAPVLVGHVNSVMCVVEYAHVTSEPPKRFWQMPRVTVIEIKGLSLENRGGSITLGAWVTERIVLHPTAVMESQTQSSAPH
eukprot:GILI01037809.1.p1 GENE.GILI01037809.1~~GILI01037809.1.p1  ORF type:complete len:582 (-),score=92.77 GILI01037809.1:162-1844(-)